MKVLELFSGTESFSNLGARGKVLRAVIPRDLCLEIIKKCEEK